MFNLFGSLFFGNRAPLVPESTSSQVDSSTQTTALTTSMHTHTHIQNTQHSQELTFIGPLNYNETSVVGNTSLDWVIVDRAEEADKCSHRRHKSNDAAMNTSTSHLEPQQASSDGNNEQADGDDDQHMQQTDGDDEQEAKHEEENTRIKMFERADDDNDIILGSFFEKNENDSTEDSHRYKIRNDNDKDDQVVRKQQQQQQQDWQITPLPCLTSTVTSQRSLVDEDPLENLLIEHPSMSVFVSATSSSSSSSNSPVSKKKCDALIEEENENEDEYDYMLSMLFNTVEAASASKNAHKIKKAKQAKKTVKPVVEQIKPAEQVTVEVEKRKECSPHHHHHHLISIVNNFNENNGRMAATLKRKKNKKSKKSSSTTLSSSSTANTLTAQSPIGPCTKPVSFNKENLQVKALLMNEYKRNGHCFASCSSQLSQSRSIEALFNNKNQMKRSNKSSAFASTKNLNQKQRKYHKLNQPACISGSSSMQF